MKKLLFFFSAILIVFNSCKTIKVIESHHYTYYLLNTNKFNSPYTHPIIYNKGNLLLLNKRKARYNFNSHYIKKQLDFVKEKDTMSIFCLCGQSDNYFLKNLHFKKGEYFIAFNYTNIKEIKGSQLVFSTKLQNILFEDYKRISPAGTPRQEVVREDVYFRNLIFKIIDFSDTTSVKLEPIKKEEFWDNSFLPTINNE